MPIEKACTLIKARRRSLYAILFTSILLLPIVDAGSVQQPSNTIARTPARMDNLTVTITQPVVNGTYFNGRLLGTARNNTVFVYGSLAIKANVTGTNVSMVEFFVDGKKIGNDSTAPYEANWTAKLSFNLKTFSIKHNITVTAYRGNETASATIENVSKWRFHVAPFVLIAGAMLPLLIPRTIVRGIIFNLHKNVIGYSFFAIRVHYRSVNIFKRSTGTIVMKRVRVGPALSMHVYNLAPIRIARISSTFLGTFN
jgi:hypothetical protein